MKSLQSLSYKTLFIIFFLSLAGIIFFLKIGNKNITKVSAAWWDESWHYRKSISVTNSSGSNLTDFQVSISIGTSQLVADGKMQNDCDDIRITDINGNLLPYWVSGCNTSDTKIWPKMPLLPSTGSAIYLYYGNPSAQSGKTKTGTSDYPGLSCKSILDAGDSTGNTNYWIDPTNGNTSDKFQAYCDMTNDSGGWMLVTQSMINSEIGSSTTPTKTTNANGGVDFSIMNNNSSCAGSYYRVLFTDIIPWTKIKADYEFLGGNSCWSIFGNTGYNAGTNLIPFASATDTIHNQIKMGGSNGDTYDGINTRCDNVTYNFWHSNQGVGTTRSAQVILRRNSMSTLAGLGTGTACSAAGYPWKYKNIYIREDTMTFSASSTPQSEESGGGPIAYWKFDEGSGTIFYDSSGNNLNGSIGSTNWAAENQCFSGKCVQKNGSVSYNPKFNITSNVTYNFWAKITQQNVDTWPTLFGRNSHLSYSIRLNKSANNVYFEYGNGACNSSTWGTINLNSNAIDSVWHMYTVTLAGTTIKTYLDSKLVGSANVSSFCSDTSAPFYIGSNLFGYLDEAKIYPYARTADQIKLDYNSRGSLSGSSANLGIKSNTAPSLKSKLVAYYKFDEGNGTSFHDSVSNYVAGVSSSSAPTWQNNNQCYKDKCLSFNGIGNEISLGNGSNFDFSTGDFTISAWINQTSTANNKKIIFKGNPFCDTCTGGYTLFTHAGVPYLSVNLTTANGDIYSVYNSSYTINDGKWHYVSGQRSGDTIKLFIDGKLISTKNLPTGATIVDSGSYFYISGNNPYSYDGSIDDLKIYNTALTDEQIKQDYNQGSAISFGSTTQNIGGTTTSLDYCIPGDTSYCASPVAEWNFEENTGTTAKDISGNNNNFTFNAGTSAPSWTTGKKNSGTALKFDGTSNWIQRTLSPSISANTDYTQCLWFNPTANTTRQVMIDDANQWEHWIALNTNRTIMGCYYNTAQICTTSSATVNLNTWNHTCLSVQSGQKMSLYLNGMLVSQNTNIGSSLPKIYDDVCIGANGGGHAEKFSGKIDDVKIYNYARTPAQIAYDYNKGAPVGWWKMDECQGSVINDSSGNGNIGTLSIGQSGTQNSIGTCQIGTSAAWTAGASGHTNGSLNFDGTDDSIDLNKIIIPTKDFSISSWFYPTDGNNYRSIIGQYSAGQSGRLWYGLYNNSFGYRIGSQSQTVSIDLNKWTQGIITRNGSEVKIYINGQLTNTNTANEDIYQTNTMIGKYISTDGFFAGKIDDVRIYNYALTPEQVKQVYNGGAINFQ